MPRSSGQDVVIRSRSTLEGTEFIIVCGKTARLLGGPFEAMADALGFAQMLAKNEPKRILYEAHDERGRAIGERMVLRAEGV
jgi:hypothetical protein